MSSILAGGVEGNCENIIGGIIMAEIKKLYVLAILILMDIIQRPWKDLQKKKDGLNFWVNF